MMTEQRAQPIWLWLALGLASLTSVTMLVLRMVYTGAHTYSFLVWNLFLAWLPFLFAWIIYRRPKTAVLFGPLWLIFLPNAPYIVTDLMHLSWHGGAPIWYDALMVFTFALTGLLLGLVSLYLLQLRVARHLGEAVSWLFVVFVLGISSYGVYIGRFLRWNSWDLFTQPHTLLLDILNSLLHLRTWTMTAFLAGLMIFAYVVFYALPRMQRA